MLCKQWNNKWWCNKCNINKHSRWCNSKSSLRNHNRWCRTKEPLKTNLLKETLILPITLCSLTICLLSLTTWIWTNFTAKVIICKEWWIQVVWVSQLVLINPKKEWASSPSHNLQPWASLRHLQSLFMSLILMRMEFFSSLDLMESRSCGKILTILVRLSLLLLQSVLEVLRISLDAQLSTAELAMNRSHITESI